MSQIFLSKSDVDLLDDFFEATDCDVSQKERAMRSVQRQALLDDKPLFFITALIEDGMIESMACCYDLSVLFGKPKTLPYWVVGQTRSRAKSVKPATEKMAELIIPVNDIMVSEGFKMFYMSRLVPKYVTVENSPEYLKKVHHHIGKVYSYDSRVVELVDKPEDKYSVLGVHGILMPDSWPENRKSSLILHFLK